MSPYSATIPLLVLLFSALVNALKLTSLLNDHPYSDIEPAQSSHDGAGVDISFPMHHVTLLDQERRQFYTSYVTQCQEKMGLVGYFCEASERARLDGNLFQPQRMNNYTDIGFKKIATPSKLHELLSKFYQTADKHEEAWDRHAAPDGNAATHLNHWDATSQLVDFSTDAGEKLRNFIWDDTQIVLQDWTGVHLSPSSLYGRVYGNHSLIAPHVDAEPMVISAVIRISQDLEEPWAIEMIDHNGKAHNVTLADGEMLLYEGASVIHGRPYPMKGVHASSLKLFSKDVFVHFEPIRGYMDQPPLDINVHTQGSLEDLYQQALSKVKGVSTQHNNKNVASLKSSSHPSYIEAGSLHAKRWMQTHERSKLRFVLDTSNLNAHTAASAGDLEALIALAEKDLSSIKKVDENGWTPLHEAVRSDNVEVLKWLVSQGLDYNLRTHHGDGGSPLWWAKKYHGKNSNVVKYLESKGAIDVAPDKNAK